MHKQHRQPGLHSWRRVLALALGLVLPAACGSSPAGTNPNTTGLAAFVSGVQTSYGTLASAQPTGTPPASNGGPIVTATAGNNAASATVSNGRTALVQLNAATPFQTVFASVIDGPLDGFYTLTLPAETTSAVIALQLGNTIPVNTFQTVFSVRTAAGQVGLPTSFANTVTAGGPPNMTQAGNWGYALTVHMPLNQNPDRQCSAPASGTTAVSSSGNFSIPFSVACEACSMTGTATGTIAGGTSVSGSVDVQLSGSDTGPGGCTHATNARPIPDPAPMSGICSSSSCFVNNTSTGSYDVSYILTPP